MEEFAAKLELLPVIAVAKMMILIDDLWLIFLSANLSRFLQNQIVLRQFIKSDKTSILHKGDQFLWQSCIASWIVVKLHWRLGIEISHCQIDIAKVHSRNKWVVDSCIELLRLHIKDSWQPLKARLSFVGSLLCKLLQTIRDFEGGMKMFQMLLDQGMFWPSGQWKWYASLNERSLWVVPNILIISIKHKDSNLLYNIRQNGKDLIEALWNIPGRIMNEKIDCWLKQRMNARWNVQSWDQRCYTWSINPKVDVIAITKLPRWLDNHFWVCV